MKGGEGFPIAGIMFHVVKVFILLIVGILLSSGEDPIVSVGSIVMWVVFIGVSLMVVKLPGKLIKRDRR